MWVDSLGTVWIEEKECVDKYRDSVRILPLSFIDYVLSITEWGSDSIKVSVLIQSKFNQI